MPPNTIHKVAAPTSPSSSATSSRVPSSSGAATEVATTSSGASSARAARKKSPAQHVSFQRTIALVTMGVRTVVGTPLQRAEEILPALAGHEITAAYAVSAAGDLGKRATLTVIRLPDHSAADPHELLLDETSGVVTLSTIAGPATAGN